MRIIEHFENPITGWSGTLIEVGPFCFEPTDEEKGDYMKNIFIQNKRKPHTLCLTKKKAERAIMELKKLSAGKESVIIDSCLENEDLYQKEKKKCYDGEEQAAKQESRQYSMNSRKNNWKK